MHRFIHKWYHFLVLPSGIYSKQIFKWYLCKIFTKLYKWFLVIIVSSGIQLTMVLRMVQWCTPIDITLQRSIFYTLASLGRHCLLYFLSKHMCKLQSKLLAHMQGEQLLPFGVYETCPYPFTHGKYAWASNMDSIEFQFKSLYKGCH